MTKKKKLCKKNIGFATQDQPTYIKLQLKNLKLYNGNHGSFQAVL